MESKERIYERVYTVTDYYDGIRSGIADFQGIPHYYQCPRTNHRWGFEYYFFLKPIDDEIFHLALEDWEIWGRWWNAIKAGITTKDTHPALPEDRERHNELKLILSQSLVIDIRSDIRAYGKFRRLSGNYAGSPSGKFEVSWRVIPTNTL